MALSEELIERFMKVDPATIGHYIGGGYMRPKMKPINKHSKMVGPAYTIRMEGKDAAPLHYAMKHAPKGSVLVIDRCGDDTFACVGEMVALHAQYSGFAGIVIDGVATDSLGIEKNDYPVFCTGISAVITKVLGISGEVDIEINCCGAVVHPGDIVFGDADGVIVLPPDNYEDALRQAEASVAREVTLREKIKSGAASGMNIDRLWNADVMGMIAELKTFDN